MLKPIPRRSKKRLGSATSCVSEMLERRLQFSTNVLTYHNNTVGDGANLTETTLSPANVKLNTFGKISTITLDGNAYTEPLVLTGTPISSGPNTVNGASGVHDVVYVETMHDSAYAIDTFSGAILWQRSFLNTGTGTGNTVGTDINNSQNATLITAPTTAEIQCTDISPEYGILGTPVIDSVNSRIYMVVLTKEIIGGVTTFVQRLHVLNTFDGTDAAVPFLIGDTSGNNTNTTPVYTYGNGDGAVTDPYNNTGKPVVQFNALRENQRSALSLVNGTVFVNFASHCDIAPYHGWVLAFDVSNLTTNGIGLKGVFNSCPNGGEAGIWGAGGRLSFEADGNTFYFETGNGNATGALTLNAAGFPATGNYYEALVKVTMDPTTTAINQSMNGWGMKPVDYFVPYNQPALDQADQDFGSGSPEVLPDSAGVAGHPHLLLAAGKQGVIYVVDRDNMGKFDPNGDHVVNAVPNINGTLTPPPALGGVISTPVFYNNTAYVVSGYAGTERAFVLNSTGNLVMTSQTAVQNFGYLPGSPVLSANGNTGGIIWQTDRNANQLHAYDASSLATELWNSDQKPNSGDAVGSVLKMTTPTVANGEVFVGTTNALVIYGLTPPVGAVPNTPVLSASALSNTSINLSWTDSTVTPNTATSYSVEQLISGSWTPITTARGGTNSLAVGGLTALTNYSFRIRGLNGAGYSVYSNLVSVTTNNLAATVNFSSGFAGSTSQLSYNGSAILKSTAAQLTDGGATEAGSVFSKTPVDVTKFNTTFNFQTTAGAGTGDGFTFTIQRNSPTVLGTSGGALGYTSITNSAAIKFDLYSNSGEGNNSTGLYLNGAAPSLPSIDLSSSGLNLHSGNVFQATLAYDGSILTETLLDTVTGKLFSTSYTVNLTAATGTAAYVGFTGGSGGVTATQSIQSWTFSPNAPSAPAAPSALGVVVSSATSTFLSWTNNATNQTGYLLDRATDAAFSQNLITETLQATPSSFTDTYVGLASGSTFYYRLRATNTAGSSASSNSASIKIPFSPAKPTNAVFNSVDTTSISITWTDNAGVTADGYHILRAVNHGAFVQYTTLPQLNTTPPDDYQWTDTGLTPGTFYDYHIQAYNVAGYNDFVGGSATTLTVAPTGLTPTAGSASIVLTWTAPTGSATFNIYRGTTAGGEATAPIATGVTTASYTDTTAVAGTTYYYYVTALNGNLTPLNNESVASNEVSATVSNLSIVRLTGAAIGTTATWSPTSTAAQIFDGNFNTFFDPANGNLTNWAGLDMGVAQAIKQIKYAPRVGLEYRMVGGQFQASSTADFSNNVVTLYTITTAPVAGQFSTVAVNPVSNYRYIRYTGGNQWVNIAEMEVDGIASPLPTVSKISGAAIGTSAVWSPTSTVAQVFDGSLTTFFDPANNALTNWVGLDMVTPQTITQIKFAPRAGFEYRMVGGQFQVSSTADFSSNVVTLYTIPTTPAAGVLTTVNVSSPNAYRYARYVGGTQWVNIAEMEFDGVVVAPPAAVKLTGTAIGTAAVWSPTSSTAQVFDGNFSTFFDPATSSLTNWVGLDLGTSQNITQIKYAPRAGYEFRMIGGQFQVSTTADFSANVLTLYTITTAPVAGQFTTVSVSAPSPYRYVRFVGGNQWVNIAEMEVDGFTS